ncbi:MAG: PepSY domain-containing protein [Bacteroidales bacterium]|nr:PepSY domain-containing protein [Bacteroidales bacterium]
MNKIKIQDQAKQLRIYRKIHRFSASFLFLFFLFIAISGILLGWKKNSNGILLAETQIGTSTDLKQWISLDSLQTLAIQAHKEIHFEEGIIERMEVRPDKGIIKFSFENSYLGLQIDGATGAILSTETRRSDFIEQIHDGSIVDKALGWSSGSFKVFYTSLMGLGLLVFTITGYWLWAGPRKIKRKISH